jgi:hypothetical protein
MIDGPSVEKLRSENKNLTLMLQADMIAYHAPGESPQLGLPALYVSHDVQLDYLALNFTNNSIGTPEVTQLVANISTLYSPELTVGFTSVIYLLLCLN